MLADSAHPCRDKLLAEYTNGLDRLEIDRLNAVAFVSAAIAQVRVCSWGNMVARLFVEYVNMQKEINELRSDLDFRWRIGIDIEQSKKEKYIELGESIALRQATLMKELQAPTADFFTGLKRDLDTRAAMNSMSADMALHDAKATEAHQQQAKAHQQQAKAHQQQAKEHQEQNADIAAHDAKATAKLDTIQGHTKGVPPLMEESRNDDAKAIGQADAWFAKRQLPDKERGVYDLYTNCKGKITQEQMAARLGVSVKTISRRAKAVNAAFEKAGRTGPIVWGEKKSRAEVATRAAWAGSVTHPDDPDDGREE
ncbi:MAG: hypothetical protein ACOX9E_02080 [Lentisphaeria bacterium]